MSVSIWSSLTRPSACGMSPGFMPGWSWRRRIMKSGRHQADTKQLAPANHHPTPQPCAGAAPQGETSMYAIYQSGYSICGVGVDLQAATEDARPWMDTDVD